MFRKNDSGPAGQDLGLGEKVIAETQGRFLNKDGTFMARRKLKGFANASLYHAALNTSWPKLLGAILVLYLLANVIFTAVYISLGARSFPELAGASFARSFDELFFYSIQVITTLGSSPIHPVGWAAHVVLGLEGFVGILGFAILAGLVFARFSNPRVQIKFTKRALVAPYRGGTGLMLRLINIRSDELINVEAEIAISMVGADGKRIFTELPLERSKVSFFPLSWTVVHPISAGSPLFGLTSADLFERDIEVLVFIVAVDENLSREVYCKTSYKASEILFGHKFVNIIERDEAGAIFVDPARLDEVEAVPLPEQQR